MHNLIKKTFLNKNHPSGRSTHCKWDAAFLDFFSIPHDHQYGQSPDIDADNKAGEKVVDHIIGN